MSRGPIACAQCGKDFLPRLATSIYCSYSCSAKGRRAKAIQQGSPWPHPKKKTGETHPCIQCGKDVYRKIHQIKDGVRILCSSECRRLWQSRKAVTRCCAWCSKSFTLSASRALKQRFCSWACQVEGRTVTAIDRWHNGHRIRRTNTGYLMVYQPDHPDAYDDGWMPEHRYVMSKELGRRLLPEEDVHHLNRDKEDNSVSNLVVLSDKEHYKVTVKEAAQRRKEAMDRLAEYEKRFGPLA